MFQKIALHLNFRIHKLVFSRQSLIFITHQPTAQPTSPQRSHEQHDVTICVIKLVKLFQGS